MDDLMYQSNLSLVPNDYLDMAPMFEILDATARLTNANLFVVDFAKNKLVFQTHNSLFLKEIEGAEIQRDTPNPFWAMVQDEDYKILLDTREAYLKLYTTFNLAQRQNHTYIIDYRIGEGTKSMVVTQKFTPLKLTETGELWIGLFSIQSSPHNSCEHIAIFGEGFRYVYDFQKNLFVPFQEDMELTAKETSILLRAAKGFSAEQTAEDLCCSVNTIKTYKRRIFKKLHVKSITEAIRFVDNYRLYYNGSVSDNLCGSSKNHPKG